MSTNKDEYMGKLIKGTDTYKYLTLLHALNGSSKILMYIKFKNQLHKK